MKGIEAKGMVIVILLTAIAINTAGDVEGLYILYTFAYVGGLYWLAILADRWLAKGPK